MNVTIRSSDIGELTAHPELIQQAGTATVLAGTGMFVAPISTLQKMAAAPDADAGRSLKEMVEALNHRVFSMPVSSLSRIAMAANSCSSIPTPGIQHGPRIKVAIDPPNAIRPGGKEASVPFDRDKAVVGQIPQALEQQVREFIDLNHDVLMKYWQGEISSTKKFVNALRPLPRRR